MTTEIQRSDVAIGGAGAVGLFAVFECGMLDMNCHVFDALDVAGGQCAALYPEKPIFDIPGYPRILAAELVARLTEQAEPFKPVYHLGQQVVGLTLQNGGRWLVKSGGGVQVDVAAVVVAAGVGAFGPNRPPLEGIERFEGMPSGRGVQYLVTRREDYRDKRVVIAGGGDSATDWALSLAEVAAHVAVVHRRAKFRAAPESARQLQALADRGAVELVIPYQLHALEGEDGDLHTVVVTDLDGHQRRLAADVLLPVFGLSQNLGPTAHWVLNLHRHTIAVDPATCAA